MIMLLCIETTIAFFVGVMWGGYFILGMAAAPFTLAAYGVYVMLFVAF